MAEMKVFAGPPGSGKTWRAAREAVEILRPGTAPADVQRVHQELVDQGLIIWVTFHPSYSYEDFVEGYRPQETHEGNIIYSVVPGPFLRACATASSPVGPGRFHVGQTIGKYTVSEVEPGGLVLTSSVTRKDAVTEAGRQFVDFWTIRLFQEHGLDASDFSLGGQKADRRNEVSKLTLLPNTFFTNSSRHAAVYKYLQTEPEPTPVVLVIDEINRADLSRVFGELITLLEFDKRKGASEERAVTLTYSGRAFTVPAHLSIIGTMNTADKSLSTVDLALRRRFEFELMTPDPQLTPAIYGGLPLRGVYAALNRRLMALNGAENLVGHADWMEQALEALRGREAWPDSDEGRLKAVAHTLRQKTVPFLVDLFRSDWAYVRYVAGAPLFEEEDLSDLRAALDDLGHSGAAGLIRMSGWWDPKTAAWDAARLRQALQASGGS